MIKTDPAVHSRVAVLGATGCIGRQVCAAFTRENHDVVAIVTHELHILRPDEPSPGAERRHRNIQKNSILVLVKSDRADRDDLWRTVLLNRAGSAPDWHSRGG